MRETLLEKIQYRYYEFTKTIRRYYEMTRRMIYWAKKMRYSYDFDGHTIYYMLYCKLDRMYACFRDYSHCVWNSSESKPHMKKLRVIRELAKRLDKDDYSTHTNFHNNKWGKPKMTFEKIENSTSSLMHINRDNIKTKKDKELERKDFRRAITKDDLQKVYEREYFFKMLSKYLPDLWD
jgi:hypothetical protein